MKRFISESALPGIMLPMFDVIAFDADDTLWRNESNYSRFKDSFANLMEPYASLEDTHQLLDEIEVRNIEFFGYGLKSFALSMIETAIQISHGKVRGEEILVILEQARQALSAPVELFPNVVETLNALATRGELMLITKGEAVEQGGKVTRSGIAGYFRHIEIVAEKDVPTYQAILSRYRIDPKRFLMVGNSLRSDILPVVCLGGSAVYVPQAVTWFHEAIVDPMFEGLEYVQLEHIGQLPDYLDRLASHGMDFLPDDQ